MTFFKIIITPITALVLSFNAAQALDESFEFEAKGKIKSLELKDAPLTRTLDELSKKASITLVMDLPLGERTVSISIGDTSAKEALLAVLSSANLKYEFIDQDMLVVTDGLKPQEQNRQEKKSQEPANLASEKSILTLSAHIEHRESLKPLEAGLKAGEVFDAIKLKKLTPNNSWYRLPNWAAGRWHTETTTRFYHHEFQSNSWEQLLASYGIRNGSESPYGQSTSLHRVDETMGFQKDTNGQIWEYCYGQYRTVAEGDKHLIYSLVREHEVIESDKTKMVIRFLATSVFVSKTSNRIIAASQAESIQTYTSSGGSMMRCLASIKGFDENGKAESITKSVTVKMRTNPFQNWNIYNGHNMRELFTEYLETHNLAHLIPSP